MLRKMLNCEEAIICSLLIDRINIDAGNSAKRLLDRAKNSDAQDIWADLCISSFFPDFFLDGRTIFR